MVVVVASLMMTGCVARRIAWSPDGAHAAIFAGDGLHLCGPDGALSETILPGDGMGQWFSDSRRLAVVSVITGQSWQDMEKILPPQECRRAEQGGKAILDALKAGRSFTGAYNNMDGFGEYEKNASVAYLLQKEGAREQAGSYWDEMQQKQASVVQLRVGTLADGKLALGPPIVSTLRKFSDIRVSPAGTLIAYTSESDKDQEVELHLVPVDASAPPVLIAKSAAYCPDWSPDGRFLLYIRAINEATVGDQVCLGSLTRTAVQFTAGKIEVQTNSDDLAGLLFNVNSKVRCPPDGRIISAATSIFPAPLWTCLNSRNSSRWTPNARPPSSL